MSRQMMYLIAAIAAVVIGSLMFAARKHTSEVAVNPAALPTNGLITNTAPAGTPVPTADVTTTAATLRPAVVGVPATASVATEEKPPAPIPMALPAGEDSSQDVPAVAAPVVAPAPAAIPDSTGLPASAQPAQVNR